MGTGTAGSTSDQSTGAESTTYQASGRHEH
jgi:hypothetical protein